MIKKTLTSKEKGERSRKEKGEGQSLRPERKQAGSKQRNFEDEDQKGKMTLEEAKRKGLEKQWGENFEDADYGRRSIIQREDREDRD